MKSVKSDRKRTRAEPAVHDLLGAEIGIAIVFKKEFITVGSGDMIQETIEKTFSRNKTKKASQRI